MTDGGTTEAEKMLAERDAVKDNSSGHWPSQKFRHCGLLLHHSGWYGDREVKAAVQAYGMHNKIHSDKLSLASARVSQLFKQLESIPDCASKAGGIGRIGVETNEINKIM